MERVWFYSDSAHRKCGACACCVADGERLRSGVKMSLRFTEEEFQAAWKELDEPQLEGGWELFTETMGVEIYRRYRSVRKCHQTGTTAANLPNIFSSVSAKVIMNSTAF